jgi:hypothetical protein
MNRIRQLHPIRRTAGILAGLTGALLALGAASPAAFATLVPPPGGGTGGPAPAPPPVHTVVVGGMPGWQIALIAAGAALLAAALAVLAHRMWAARHLAEPSM